MGLKDRLTGQSSMKHIVEYTFLGQKGREVHGSYPEAQAVVKKLQKNKDFKNVAYRTATK